ncbi:MAG: hypothetical protein KBD64_07435 [Gammaproteobacteria bacterium]|nr:hypothetical protein [Gammaproteobacteria bacterium]
MNKSTFLANLTLSFALSFIHPVIASSDTASRNNFSEEEQGLIQNDCEESSRDLESINNQIVELQKGNLRESQYEAKIKEIMKPWYKRLIDNKCNGVRSGNDIVCPENSIEMQLLSISDAMIAIANSLKLQTEQSFTKESIIDYFKKSRMNLDQHCQKLLEDSKKTKQLKQSAQTKPTE